MLSASISFRLYPSLASSTTASANFSTLASLVVSCSSILCLFPVFGLAVSALSPRVRGRLIRSPSGTGCSWSATDRRVAARVRFRFTGAAERRATSSACRWRRHLVALLDEQARADAGSPQDWRVRPDGARIHRAGMARPADSSAVVSARPSRQSSSIDGSGVGYRPPRMRFVTVPKRP